MIVDIVNTSDVIGGAARAAFRLGQALRDRGAEVRMQVAVKSSDVSWVHGPRGIKGEVSAAARAYLGNWLTKLQGRGANGLRSANVLPSRTVDKLNALDGVVNLHWIGGEFFPLEDLPRIRRPVAWTLHDMWAFCGGEHYASDAADARWRVGYTSLNRSAEAGGLDIDRWIWSRKIRAWRRPVQIVCPSSWLADCVRASRALEGWPTATIPNPLDLAVFRPWPGALARQMLGLPQDTPLIGFGAMAGTTDPRKGWDLLEQALTAVAADGAGAEAVIFGQSEPARAAALPLRVHWMGHLVDEITLALLYSSLDVLVAPSRIDNLPQAATEAQACGCPVVAFRVGGLPDVVDHGVTGHLAPPFDVDELASGILTFIVDAERRAEAGSAARRRAERLWSADAVAAQYLALFDRLS